MNLNQRRALSHNTSGVLPVLTRTDLTDRLDDFNETLTMRVAQHDNGTAREFFVEGALVGLFFRGERSDWADMFVAANENRARRVNNV